MRHKNIIIIIPLIIIAILILLCKQQIMSYLILNTDLYHVSYIKNESISLAINPETALQTRTYEKYNTSISVSWKHLDNKTIIKISAQPHYNLTNGYFVLPLEIKNDTVNSSINNQSLKVFEQNNNKEFVVKPSLSMWYDSNNVEFEIDHTLFKQYNALPLENEAVNIQVEPFIVYQYSI